MGEEEDSQAEADDLSGGQEARCGGAADKVGEGEDAADFLRPDEGLASN